MSPDLLSRNGGVLRFRAWIDGGSRGNPGPAGWGAFVTSDEIAIRARGFLGVATNNVAEYTALIEALTIALDEGASEIAIASDSLLLVQQMLGKYRVKHPNLVPLYGKAKILASRFGRFSIRHVYREDNRIADALANDAMDTREARTVEREFPGGM